MSTTEEKPAASEASTQEEAKDTAKTHDVQYADDETTAKVIIDTILLQRRQFDEACL